MAKAANHILVSFGMMLFNAISSSILKKRVICNPA